MLLTLIIQARHRSKGLFATSAQHLANNIIHAARKVVHFTEFTDFEDGDAFVVVAALNWRPDIGKPENGRQFANIHLLVGYD
jgi:hypothetical protein